MGVQDLMTTESTTQDVIETERAGLAKYTEDKNNEILGLNNELARLQTKLEEEKASAMKWYVHHNTIQCTTTNYLTPDLWQTSPHMTCIGLCQLHHFSYIARNVLAHADCILDSHFFISTLLECLSTILLVA